MLNRIFRTAGGDGVSAPVPAKRSGPVSLVVKHQLVTFGDALFLELRVAIMGRRYWKRSGSLFLHVLPPFFAGPIVVLVGIRWLHRDDPQWETEITNVLAERGRA